MFRTKEDVLNAIKKEQERIFSRDGFFLKKSLVYCHALNDIYQCFCEKLSEKNLFDAPDGWHYEVERDVQGVRLYIVNEYAESYMLLEQRARMLTTEEYAKVYGVDEITVRQWIRRGKLRTAVKYGNEWRITGVTDLPTRGWQDVSYSWEQKFEKDNDKFPCNSYERVSITRKTSCSYILGFLKSDKSCVELECTKEEREMFELFLISSPNVHYDDEEIVRIS